MYYNKTQKDRYLSTLSAQTAKDACKYIFNQAFERENMLALDLALWPRSEVIRFVEVLAGLDADSTKKRIDRIMDYQYWSASTSSNYVQLEEETPAFLNGEISVDEIDITDVIRENLYPSFSSVIQKVKMVLPDQPGYVIFPLIAFAWLNIPKKIMGQIPRDGVDFEQHTIVDEDGHILIHAIPAEIEQVLYSYITTKEGRKGNARVFPLENGKFLRLMEPLGTKKIPKPFSPIDINGQFNYMQGCLQAALCNGNMRFSCSNIQRSGQYARLYELECDGVELSDPANACLLRGAYGKENKIYDILAIYRQYKKAFNLT